MSNAERRVGLEQILSSESYDLRGMGIATALAAAAIFALGIAVVARGRRSFAAVLFFVVSMLSAGWLAAFALMYSANMPDIALFWARTGHLMAAVIPAAVFQFAAETVRQRQRFLPISILFWIACASIGIISATTPLIIPFVRSYDWGFYPAAARFNGAMVSAFAAIMIASVILFWRAWRTSEGIARERAGSLMQAFVILGLGLIDYLPAIGYNVQPVGYMSTLMFTIVAAISIWRYELGDVTPEVAAGQILATMKGAVLVVDLEGTVRVANRAACALLGYSEAEITRLHIRDIVEPDENYSTAKLLKSTGVSELNMAWRARDGSRLEVLSSSSFVRDNRGTAVAIVYVASDFTERKRAEEALRESEYRYRSLFDANPLPMWVYEFDTLRFVAVNDAALKHYGYTREEFLQRKITDIRPPEDVPAIMAMLPSLPDKSMPHEVRHMKKDGTVFVAEAVSFELMAVGRRTRLVIAQDVTERKRAEELLRASEERYRELFENATDILYTHDLSGNYTSINVAGERITGYNRDEVLGLRIDQIVAPEYLESSRAAFAAKLRGESSSTFYETEIIAKDGRHIPLEVSTRLIYDDGKPIGVQGIARDITERKANEARYRVLFERNLAGVYRSTIDGRILDCNEACARIFGFDDRQQFIEHPADWFYSDKEDRLKLVDRLRREKSIMNLELRMRRRDRSPLWVLENITLLEGHGPEEDIMEGTIIDITDRKFAQEQMEYQAYHDILTGLPNRLLFRDRIGMALAHSRRNNRSAAVMFLDLDQFKLVNDTLGHTFGDRLLQAIGDKLVACVRAEDTVARMGGDEFTILLSDINDRRGAATVAQKVLEAVSQPVSVDGHELFVTTSIGISIFPDDGEDAETLLKGADRAMYRAKELGRNNYQYTTPAGFQGTLGVSPEASLQQAFEWGEFVLHYQPIVEIATGRIVAAEALVRWDRPGHGLIPPGEFIGIAEATGLIVPLGEWVLRTACAQGKQWHDALRIPLRVAVNLSPRQFLQRDLPVVVERVLKDTGFPADCLDLEITESTAMQNAEISLTTLNRLKEMGIRISIDDFGTGYSSLSYLKRFPIDTVKIDREFVADLSSDSNDAAIISAMISMSRALKLRVVAEGVETEEQLAFLQREQCTAMQGFLFSRPVPAEQFEQRLTLVNAQLSAEAG